MMDDMHERQVKLQKELEDLNPGSTIEVHIRHVPRWRYRVEQALDGVSWGFGVVVGIVIGVRFLTWAFGHG